MNQPYSVLMSVYAKEQPAFLVQSVKSMAAQSCAPSEILLVCDGPLTAALDKAVAALQKELGPVLRVHRLAQNTGLGIALREGLALCRHELVARMDSDDMALPDRCQRQLEFLTARQLDICSGIVTEFSGDISRPLARRSLPEEHEALRRFARSRNPLNHPAVLFRKEAVLRAGSYQNVPWFEDYDLWVRMFQTGARFGNLAEPLVMMRVDEGSYLRRGGWAYFTACQSFWRRTRQRGFISRAQLVKNLALRGAVSLVPNRVRAFIYQKSLRERESI